ncbi:MobV family relaxase, partial [Bacillus paranthracis]
KEVDTLKEYRTDAIVYKSMLQDINKDLEISDTEKKGRLILHSLENGHKPKNRKEGEQWLSILEENKEAKTIPQKRLEGFIERLKEFLDKILGEERKYSLSGLKRQSEQSKKRETTKDTKK